MRTNLYLTNLSKISVVYVKIAKILSSNLNIKCVVFNQLLITRDLGDFKK